MRRNVFIMFVLSLMIIVGCGHTSMDNEMMGQVKKVVGNTPLVCPNYTDADVSLGVIKNGTGSMSTQDAWVVIEDKKLIPIFKQACETGQLVKIKYDVKRFGGNYFVCTPEKFATNIEILK